MGELMNAAGRIVEEMKQIQPGEKRTIELSGYYLSQGVRNFIELLLEQHETGMEFREFQFDWDEIEAQSNTQDNFPVVIYRTRS